VSKKLLWAGLVLAGIVIFAGCVRRPTIQVDYGPRLDAIEARLEKIEQAIEELKLEEQEFTKATTNDEILYENMEQLYQEVDELREKMGMSLSKPRRKLVK
jgi:DNA repair ATPase RecN